MIAPNVPVDDLDDTVEFAERQLAFVDALTDADAHAFCRALFADGLHSVATVFDQVDRNYALKLRAYPLHFEEQLISAAIGVGGAPEGARREAERLVTLLAAANVTKPGVVKSVIRGAAYVQDGGDDVIQALLFRAAAALGRQEASGWSGPKGCAR
ncbi:hypothetical protein [Pandoraea sp. ISTKB]|uniref:hypothetical protein n=1 Tax=Pandoraea sp. ISTKB TaxID=1586708 RepID=UPI001480DB3E|nr:hypothetical protein [Pandoraea sp. ISTKB]